MNYPVFEWPEELKERIKARRVQKLEPYLSVIQRMSEDLTALSLGDH